MTSDCTAGSESGGQVNQDQDDNEVLGLDADRERKQEDFLLGVQHAKSHQDRHDRTRRTHGRFVRAHEHHAERTGEQRGAVHDAEPQSSDGGLELRAEDPQREHVEADLQQAGMEEATGVRRETASTYLRAAGVVVSLPGCRGRHDVVGTHPNVGSVKAADGFGSCGAGV